MTYVPLLYWVKPQRSYQLTEKPRFTILDPDLSDLDGLITFRNPVHTSYGDITELVLPQEDNITIGSKIIITDLQFAMNKILQMIHTAQSEKGLVIAVERYIDTLIETTFGKNGVINRMVLGFRATNASFDGVLLTDPDLDVDVVSINASDGYAIGLKHDDVVLVVRQPVLWKQSLIPRLVKFHKDRKVVYLHPSSLPGMGGDCDGDRVTIFKLENQNMYNTAMELLKEDWHFSKDRYADVKYGVSLSLQDARNNTIDTTVEKHIHPDYRKFLDGLSDADLEKEIESIVADNVRMKLELGAAGSTSQKMRMIATNKDEMYSANVFSEWLTQSLLSIKHGTSDSNVSKVNELLENVGKLSDLYGFDALIMKLQSLGMPTAASLIVYRILLSGGRLSTAVSNSSSLYLATQNSPKAFDRAMCIKDMHPLVSKLLDSTSKITISDFITDVQKELLGDRNIQTRIS